ARKYRLTLYTKIKFAVIQVNPKCSAISAIQVPESVSEIKGLHKPGCSFFGKMTTASSLVSPAIVTQLNQVLSDLISNDNDLRSKAEKQLNEQWIAQQPDLLLLSLSQLGRSHQETHGRSFSFVLLRRIAFKQAPNQTAKGEEVSIWDYLQEQSRQAIKNELLMSLSVERENTVRHKVCDAVSEVVKNSHLKGQKWVELLPALFEASKSPSAEHREAALRIFSAVPNLITDQSVDVIKQIFSANLQDADNADIRMASLKAAVAFMLETDQQSRNSFTELMPQMLAVLSPLVSQRDEDGLVDGIMVFIELGENLPRVFRPVLPILMPFAISIIKDESFEDGTRQTALELLLTLSETSPSMMRKVPDFCSQIIPISLKMMTELDDTEEWYTTDDLEDDDNDENYVIGEHAMDRLARNLGGKAVLPIAFNYIPVMLGSPKWEERHAALMAISAIGEGCVKIMESELGKIIDLVLPFLRDPHPRVRYAACNAVGQMSTDFQDSLQRKFHHPVLTNLIPVMGSPEPRVQAHAAAALVNFCEAADKSILEPYLDTIFEKLLVLLNSGRTYVQEQAITSIAIVADSAEDRFVKYYSAIMPLLINVLRNAHQKEYRLLRGKAMECASLIALAVGKEIFASNAEEFIQLLVQTQRKICKVLGADFVPYLPIIMPPLLQSAQLKPDFAILDSNDDIESKYSPEDGWEFVGVDGQQIGIKTTVMEEKCTAVEMLICYARELGPAFQPYVENVLEIVLPLLKFYFHDGVRNAAAATIPHLLNAAKKANASRDYLINMWHSIAKKITEVIISEADPGFLWQLYVTFHESLEIVGDNSLEVPHLEAFTKATEDQLQEFYSRLKQREQARHSGDIDAEDEDIINEEEATEEGVLGELSKALHVILKTHRTSYLPSFDKLLPIVTTFLADANPAARQWALCVIDDVVEFTGPASWNYHSHFLEKMIASLMDIGSFNSAYGIGVCAQFGGENYSDAVASALTPLFQAISSEGSRKDENVYATENAISAITKILKFNNSKFDVNSVLPAWFSTLPILNDEEEASLTYTYLLDLLESQHPAVLGNNNENLPRIITIFVEVLALGILPEFVASRMATAMKAILSGLPDEIKASLWNQIDPEKRKALQDMNYV
ncbi:8999_t:CDS:10, partial [Acaulospora morrowiae]